MNIKSLLWDTRPHAKGLFWRREKFLKNNMKENKLPVVAVVRGAKVDIGDMIATGAALKVVRALEKWSRRNVEIGMPVQKLFYRPCLSHFFTIAVDAASERVVRNVCNGLATAPAAKIKCPCLSTVFEPAKENW